ncbi:hypothetical protein [Clostridium kluyveri]|uniref:Uncharacterized protein n=1 Tax=Clostridium kluyveri (strain ATCC 8527 / DSM 555 / NBRC 12016 / NCIMB 10680 / K1) TaxID=431943 RepID=A5N8W1_CLOK5|nr:hypothetical protein [Clostridium kluyveri]EDK33742.1 Hypothetical protein CKL_1700 [Clostridium kluyveri DSM 555]
MKWIIVLVYILICFYTVKIGIGVWKEGKKFASINIMILALIILFLSIWIEINNRL